MSDWQPSIKVMKITPFQRFALSLSGGGYRASAFHLGVLSYLNRVQWQGNSLLSRLVALSTISGGSITGMKYALCMAQGKTFPAFFEELYSFLSSNDLVAHSLATLNRDDAWKETLKRRNLINAFAFNYHQRLLDRQDFGFLLDQPLDRFPEVIFNCTDLEHQLPFRFQVSESGLIGNGYSNITKEAAKEIRLADILAASSCFPGGFEPMYFIEDFAKDSQSPLSKAYENQPTLRLMDGGIVDNQGIESIRRFEKRKTQLSDAPFISTYFISDVTRKQADYTVSNQVLRHFFLNFSLRFYYLSALVLFILSGVALFFWVQKWIVILATVLCTFSALLMLVVGYIQRKLRSYLEDKASEKHSASMPNHLNIIQSVALKYLIDQFFIRMTSVARLPDVFMKRIRDQSFQQLFNEEEWSYRIKTNLIYSLLDREEDLGALGPFVEKANQMDTTLWFPIESSNEPLKMLDALIVTGQATTCSNVIKYIEELKEKHLDFISDEDRVALDQLQAQCRNDFEQFKSSPLWMVAGV